MFSLTWYGNAALKIQAGSARIVFDPYVSAAAPDRETALAAFGEAEAYCLTHGHFDHAAELTALCMRHKVRAYMPQEVRGNLNAQTPAASEFLHALNPGDDLLVSEVRLTPLSGRHVRFDWPLVIGTAWRSARHPGRTASLLAGHFRHPLGRCLAWQIEYRRFHMLHFGSLGLDPNQYYPSEVDVLSLPMQGHSRIHDKAFEIIAALRPRRVFLHHFDDAFPPLSREVSLRPLIERLAREMPEVGVLVPRYGVREVLLVDQDHDRP